ncbi:hypothetical protein EW146_g8565 [Bondarzewia mesenterica]|uniref:Mitochondrial inner membrane protease ATP23 n=1 Tax=Bondarzewia mesenterica TaxID=1095465 RepID=A0A4S4LIW2_9AGAM|nr:hypothetical protein EW146_g8565 [Bondarzewia mesenterica]
MSAADSSSTSAAGSSSTSASTNKLFQKWSREFSLLTGYGISHDERVYEIGRRNCEKWKKELMNFSPQVVFMMQQLKLAGADVQPEHLPCIPCNLNRSGGFSPEMGAVLLCQGNFMNKKHMEHTMVHELVHMFDHVKFKVNWNDLRHHACSEIRASSLSGDCTWTRELQRGIVKFSKQHQTCVRRRAILSVLANPACPDEATAERAVNEVWESCFNDTRPFDEMFNKLSVLVALVPFVAGLTLNVPDNLSSGGPATISWTTASGDPSTFSIELLNTIFHNSFAIANNVQPSLGSITIQLPAVPPGDGYTLEAVNITDINQVFATTGGFSIAAPSSSSVASSTSAASSASGSASGSGSSASASATAPSSSSSFGRTVSSSATPSSGSASRSGSSSAAPASSSPVSFNAGSNMKYVGAGSVGAMVVGAVIGAAVMAL